MSFLGKRIDHGYGSASEDEEYEASRKTEEKLIMSIFQQKTTPG